IGQLPAAWRHRHPFLLLPAFFRHYPLSTLPLDVSFPHGYRRLFVLTPRRFHRFLFPQSARNRLVAGTALRAPGGDRFLSARAESIAYQSAVPSIAPSRPIADPAFDCL